MNIKLFDKQTLAYSSQKPIVTYIGGIQCGKTTVGALWMFKKNLQYTNPDDSFIIATPDYKTLEQAALPKYLKMLTSWGRHNAGRSVVTLFSGAKVYMRTMTHPESLEGISNVRAIWCDELGQFSKYFWENIMGRAAFCRAQIFGSTTPYAMNWLSEIVKTAQAGKRDDVDVIQLKSIDSPYFPVDTYETQKKLLDPRRFKMKYEGVFGQIEGLVFDKMNLCKTQSLPTGTKYYAGIDWGYTDPFCLVIRALTPDRKHYRVGEYYKSFLTIAEVCQVVKQRHQIFKFESAICDPSQPAHIEELCRQGVPAMAGDNRIRFGIDKHYELIKDERFWIFEDANPYGIDEYCQYHYPEEKERKVDDDAKERLPVDASNHGIDCDRMVSVFLEQSTDRKVAPHVQSDARGIPKGQRERLEWLKKGGSSRYNKHL